MENDLISVIVPVYNVEKYLRQCLDSILNQTYKNLEVIMVDDGSSDNSGRICDEYAAKYENFISVHKQNAGLGMARNTGMEHMSGKYVMFLDSDDYIDEDLIEKLYLTIKKCGADICKSGFHTVADSGECLSERKYADEFFPGNEAAKSFLPRMVGSAPDKKDSYEMSVCASLYNAEIIKENNISFPSERKLISEDLIFNIDYAQHANGAAVVSYIGYNYRRNFSSLTKVYRADRFEATMRYYAHAKSVLEKLNYGQDVLYRLDRIIFIYIKAAIWQERPKVSGKSNYEAMKSIGKILRDERVCKIINGYPIGKLGFKQKAFVYMMKYKMSAVIYLCSILGIA